MKKIIALLITVTAFTSVFSQSSRKIEDARRIINGDTRTNEERRVYGDGDTRSTRDSEADRIYNEYDRKIAAVRNNPLLSAEEKERRIRDLQNERDRRIREINGYSKRDRKYDDDDDNYKKNKKHKQNPGKRKGWTKGKGNPHKNENWKN